MAEKVKELKVKDERPKAEDDVQLPELPQWTKIVGRPTSLGDLDPNAETTLENVEATFLTLGDLAYLDAITETEITDNSISTPKLQAGAVEASKISVGSLSAINANLGTITSGTITGVLFRTSASGERIEMDTTNTNQIRFYDDSTLFGKLEVDRVGTDGYIRFLTDEGNGLNIQTGLGASVFTSADLQGNGGVLSTNGNASNGYIGMYANGASAYWLVNRSAGNYKIITDLRIDEDWLPYVDDTYDLGSSTYRWEYAHISEGVRLYEPTGSDYIQIEAPSLSASWTLRLPNNDGANGQVLTTDGAGNTSWENGGSFDPSSVGEDILPASANAYNLGSSLNYWAGVYTDDLYLDSGGNIYHNGELVFDFSAGSNTIWVGSADYGQFNPYTTIGVNLGESGERFNTVFCDTVDELSDIRVKKNVKPLHYGLKEVLNLETITYNLKKQELPKGDHTRTRIGFSAQQVAQVIPEVAVNCEPDSEVGTASLRRIDLIPVLVRAIQELNTKVEALQSV